MRQKVYVTYFPESQEEFAFKNAQDAVDSLVEGLLEAVHTDEVFQVEFRIEWMTEEEYQALPES